MNRLKPSSGPVRRGLFTPCAIRLGQRIRKTMFPLQYWTPLKT